MYFCHCFSRSSVEPCLTNTVPRHAATLPSTQCHAVRTWNLAALPSIKTFLIEGHIRLRQLQLLWTKWLRLIQQILTQRSSCTITSIKGPVFMARFVATQRFTARCVLRINPLSTAEHYHCCAASQSQRTRACTLSPLHFLSFFLSLLPICPSCSLYLLTQYFIFTFVIYFTSFLFLYFCPYLILPSFMRFRKEAPKNCVCCLQHVRLSACVEQVIMKCKTSKDVLVHARTAYRWNGSGWSASRLGRVTPG